ncbi:MAG: DUF1622 domain-containing protein [Solirubrobacterales bacterium]
MTHPRLPVELTHGAAAVPLAIGAAIITVGALLALFAGRRAGSSLAEHISLGLEFLLAAGLLRLASADQLAMLGLVGAIILARRAIVLGVRYGARAWG